MLRFIREDDSRGVDASFGTGCNADVFERKVIEPAAEPFFIRTQSQHPLSLEWLQDLPPYDLFVQGTDSAAVRSDATSVLLTALAGDGASYRLVSRAEGGGFVQEFEINLPSSRNSGERELEMLGGSIESSYSREHGYSRTPFRLRGRVRGAAEAFEITITIPRSRSELICGPEDASLPLSECRLDVADEEALELGDVSGPRSGLVGMLAFVPPAREFGEDDIVVERVAMRLHGLRFGARERQSAAGTAVLSIGVEAFDVDATFSGGTGCTSVPIDVDPSLGQQLQLAAPLFTTAAGQSPLQGAVFVPSISARYVPGLESSAGGSEYCRSLLALADFFFGVDTTVASFDLGPGSATLAGQLLMVPIMESVFIEEQAPSPWMMHASSRGRMTVIGPAR